MHQQCPQAVDHPVDQNCRQDGACLECQVAQKQPQENGTRCIGDAVAEVQGEQEPRENPAPPVGIAAQALLYESAKQDLFQPGARKTIPMINRMKVVGSDVRACIPSSSSGEGPRIVTRTTSTMLEVGKKRGNAAIPTAAESHISRCLTGLYRSISCGFTPLWDGFGCRSVLKHIYGFSLYAERPFRAIIDALCSTCCVHTIHGRR